MIDNDQITALAREYAEQTDGSPADIAYIISIAENTIRFLLRRYCLVEKEKLQAIRFRKVYSAEDLRSKFTEECMIDALFPDLGKEVDK